MRQITEILKSPREELMYVINKSNKVVQTDPYSLQFTGVVSRYPIVVSTVYSLSSTFPAPIGIEYQSLQESCSDQYTFSLCANVVVTTVELQTAFETAAIIQDGSGSAAYKHRKASTKIRQIG